MWSRDIVLIRTGSTDRRPGNKTLPATWGQRSGGITGAHKKRERGTYSKSGRGCGQDHQEAAEGGDDEEED